MITLVGTLHSDVRRKSERLRNVVSALDPDHLFTEGMSLETIKREEEENLEHIYREVDRQLDLEITWERFEEDFNGIVQGPEPDYIEHEIGTLDPENITFLDDNRSLEHSIYTVKELLDVFQNGSDDVGGITQKELEQKIIQGTSSKEDFLDYFRNLRDKGVNELQYTAISYPTRFHGYKKKLSEDFGMNAETSLMDKLDLANDMYQKQFLQELQDHRIDRFDLQSILDETRDHEYQVKRDGDWYSQIIEYRQENPGEEIAVLCGLGHVTAVEDTLRDRLEDYGYDRHSLQVKPYDYELFNDSNI